MNWQNSPKQSLIKCTHMLFVLTVHYFGGQWRPLDDVNDVNWLLNINMTSNSDSPPQKKPRKRGYSEMTSILEVKGGQWTTSVTSMDFKTLIWPQIRILHPKKPRKRHPTCVRGRILKCQGRSLDDVSDHNRLLSINSTQNSNSPPQNT